ncbi:His-Xaa-Ser system radical SAM maturase HxsB [Sphingomonas sp. BK069]|uniref:His-Xaa-Ser system radical SAM maturase HxsB n=1 Tax=Sphingomonas sp. BK069 TaxID=2586979 RepID=UPI00180B7B1C|nr:His-Xaa-Ser system radical SAM maturase HxsB [Sphingomonas sp. BK069]MBB3348391.1 His-Xaa-Ser system radical SAM maturase HxsB [Sphingomonas sp. BK069]
MTSTIAMRAWPLADDHALLVGDGGAFACAPLDMLTRIAGGDESAQDVAALERAGLAVSVDDPLGWMSHLHAVARRRDVAGTLDYLILVPTLRCNLNCSYCQVSRVAQTKVGYDWSDETLADVLALLDSLPGDRIKIEFQGGEPTLRPDLIRAVIARTERFGERQFVICTNLQRLDDEIWAILQRDDVFVSTSLDGAFETHARQRTGSVGDTTNYFSNLDEVLARLGPEKVSALPTIDPQAPPDAAQLIDAYASRGLASIFLRPINYQGFARKRHAQSREQDASWHAYHERFVRELIARNWRNRDVVLEETYFSIILRRIFQPGADRHVDLRNPNPMGVDYVVVDHDGRVFPTDEARMLTRSGVIDLAIGTVSGGWDGPALQALNAHASNDDDPACGRCAFQPFCGRDVIDDVARYGRIDKPRHETAFCQRHQAIFDLAFRLIYEDDPAVRHSLARWLRLPGTPSRMGQLLA